MKTIDIFELNKSLVETIVRNGINISDVKYIELYRDYKRLKEEGHKITWVVQFLSGEYDVCERKIYTMVKEFEKEILLV